MVNRAWLYPHAVGKKLRTRLHIIAVLRAGGPRTPRYWSPAEVWEAPLLEWADDEVQSDATVPLVNLVRLRVIETQGLCRQV